MLNNPSPEPELKAVTSEWRQSFNPSVREGNNVWLSADLLYWLPREKSIAFLNQPSNVLVTDDFTTKREIFPHFEWGWGYRLGIGYLFAQNKWDVSLNLTHFHGLSTQTKGRSNPRVGMFPIWSTAEDIIEGDYVTFGKMLWRLHLNILSLKFARDLPLGGRFNLKPYVSLTSGWIKQSFDIEYRGGIFVSDIDNVAMRNNYWGIGPTVGIDPLFYLGRGWSLYGNATITMLLGRFATHQKETYLETVRNNEHHHRFHLGWISDVGAGLLWKKLLYTDRFALTFKLGWEYMVLFHQNDLDKGVYPVTHNRNLQLQGGTFSARFDF